MKLLTAKQIKNWDAYTIMHEPISSIDLMERAASLCTERIESLLHQKPGLFQSVYVFCGPGNNGGDGLVIARRLALADKQVKVFLLKTGSRTADFETNLKRLSKETSVSVSEIETEQQIPNIEPNAIVIDAIFGSGLNRAPENMTALVIDRINESDAYVVAIDISSGLPSEVYDIEDIRNRSIVEAELTLTFQLPKQSFLHAECFPFTGEVEVLDIGLLPEFSANAVSNKYYINAELIRSFYKPRSKFSHKGTFGHALMVAGSYGKLGAALLTSKAALRAGCGLLTSFIPKVGFTVLQTGLPEAMVQTDDELYEIRNFPDTTLYHAVGVGPGLGTNPYTEKAFAKWLPGLHLPVVLDADALNICAALMSNDPHFKFQLYTVITPHPKEFDRLAGHSNNSFERQQKQVAFAKQYKIVVVLKGAHTCIALPDGTLYFNSSGNPALATAGSGDVLTGIITSLLAQQYTTAQAAVMGVYLHGICADLWVQRGKQTMIAGDIVEMIPEALFQLASGF
jgi:hydroxyethylthiazole kinase-like uncharacterized protein yjeF